MTTLPVYIYKIYIKNYNQNEAKSRLPSRLLHLFGNLSLVTLATAFFKKIESFKKRSKGIIVDVFCCGYKTKNSI